MVCWKEFTKFTSRLGKKAASYTTQADEDGATIWYDTCSNVTPLNEQECVKGPKATSLGPDQTVNGCRVGSTVEVECNGTKTGVLRWMGYVKDPNKLLAGLEMVK